MNRFNILSRVLVILMVFALSVQFACTPPPPVVEQQNNAPVIENISFPKDVLAVQDIEISCQASDPDGDKLEYEWSADKGKITGKGANIVWISPDSMGNYTVRIKALDNKGGEATQDINIRVLNNADGTTNEPIILKVSLSSPGVVSERRTIKVGTMTKITCDHEDNEGGKFSYTWTATAGRLKGKGVEEKTASSVYWTAPAAVDEYTVIVLLNDSQGREAKGQIVFDVFCCPRN